MGSGEVLCHPVRHQRNGYWIHLTGRRGVTGPNVSQLGVKLQEKGLKIILNTVSHNKLFMLFLIYL